MENETSVRKPVKIVPKGWGREVWIANNEKYCGKILEFDEGKKFSDHFHIEKTETFYVMEGTAKLMITTSNGTHIHDVLRVGDIVDITPGLMHQITAISNFKMIEFSTQHFDHDSYRITKGD